MQFQVPQFIEVEDKIFGPLTFKQFVYMAGGAGLSYVLWRLLPSFVAVPLILGVGSLAVALGFMQYNGRPFMLAIETAFYYLIHPKLYLWNNRTKKRIQAAKNAPVATPESVYVPKLTDSRLHELAWSLDINERIAAGIQTESERRNPRADDLVTTIRTPREALRSLTGQ